MNRENRFSVTKKYLEAKRNHHHVWAHYLRRWSCNSKDNKVHEVWYSTIKGNVDYASIRGIAMQRDFYKLTELSNIDIEMIKLFLKKSPCLPYLNSLLQIQYLESWFYYKNGKDKNAETEELFYVLKCNEIENLHTVYENHTIPIIAALLEGDIRVLEDNQNMMKFMAFLGQQICRTKNFKDKALNGLSRNSDLEILIVNAIEHGWWLVSYLLGINMGIGLYDSRYNETHSLLMNNTGISFITSDTPVINVHECLKDNVIEVPEFSDYYYPLSPNVAYIICESKRFQAGKINVSVEDVNELNLKMAKSANVHIIGDSKESICSLLPYVGTQFKLIKKQSQYNK